MYELVDQLRQKIADLFDKTRPQMIYRQLEASGDTPEDNVALEYGRHYIRLWLAEVYLTQQVYFLQSWFPAVHSIVKFSFDGKTVEFPTLADASKVGMEKNQKGDVIARNYVLTPLIPFNDGTIELDAGLTAVQGQSYLNDFIATLSDFSGLLAVPQFSVALSVADPLAKGLQSLINAGGLHLALHDGFAEGRMGGYWLALRATEMQVNPDMLLVRDHQLRKKNEYDPNKDGVLEGYDYMLFRLEVTEKGPSFKSLSTIQDSMKQAHNSLKDQDLEKADGFYRAAIVAAHEAPELTDGDRGRVKRQLKEDYAELKENLGISGLIGDQYDLDRSMRRAISVSKSLELGQPSFADLFNV